MRQYPLVHKGMVKRLHRCHLKPHHQSTCLEKARGLGGSDAAFLRQVF